MSVAVTSVQPKLTWSGVPKHPTWNTESQAAPSPSRGGRSNVENPHTMLEGEAEESWESRAPTRPLGQDCSGLKFTQLHVQTDTHTEA